MDKLSVWYYLLDNAICFILKQSDLFKQASIITYTSVQCSPATVGFVKAHPGLTSEKFYLASAISVFNFASYLATLLNNIYTEEVVEYYTGACIYVHTHVLTSRCRTLNDAVLLAWITALEPACQ